MKQKRQPARNSSGKRHKPRRSGKKSVTPRTADQFFAKPTRFQDVWDRVVDVVSRMRSQKSSLKRAAQEVGISPHTVIRWGGPALQKHSNGRYAAKSSDQLLRVLMIPTSEGTREIAVRGSRQATLLAEYWNAVHRWLETGDGSRLAKYRRKYITEANGTKVLLPTERVELQRLGSAGSLSFESLYARSV